MIWAKTEAGRTEIQARALIKERAQRNLLLVIDGTKSDEMLLKNLAGISPQDFLALESLGLIVPVGGRSAAAPVSAAPAGPSSSVASFSATSSASTASPSAAANASAPGAASAAESPLDYAQFTAALTQMISKELGLRGFMLTLAVEKAGTIEELRAVAQRTIEQIRDRRGEAAATAATRALYGG